MDEAALRTKVMGYTTYQLVLLGFQTRHRGYRYLREAVWAAYMDDRALESVTKRLYPKVAKYFETSDKQVERAIRNAIEASWSEVDTDILRSFFGEIYGDGTSRPTNTEIIGKLVEWLKSQIQE